MKITRIEPQQKNPHRRNIFADDEFLIGISSESLIRTGLRVGDEVSPEKIRELETTEEQSSAKNRALRFLSRRMRSIKEVRHKLRDLEFSAEVIDRTVDDLESAGLLNDELFARMYVRHVQTLRPLGRIGLQRRLLMAGIDKDIIESVLAGEFEEFGQQEAALDAANRFLAKAGKSKRNEDPLKLRNRLASFLARRGFGWDVISPVLKQLLNK